MNQVQLQAQLKSMDGKQQITLNGQELTVAQAQDVLKTMTGDGFSLEKAQQDYTAIQDKVKAQFRELKTLTSILKTS